MFSLLGTSYGGDGQTTFGLPNLQGRTMVHQGSGAGLSPRAMGQAGGSETATLVTNNLPPHSHSLMASNTTGTSATAGGNLLANSTGYVASIDETATVTVYAPAGGATAALAPGSIGQTGSAAPVAIMSPFQVVNVCICLYGIYPSRN